MKLELVNEIVREDRSYKEFKIAGYSVGVSERFLEDGTKVSIISVGKVSKEWFLPDIYFRKAGWDSNKDEFVIQTTSYGALNPSKIQEVIKGYELAMEVVAVLTKELIR